MNQRNFAPVILGGLLLCCTNATIADNSLTQAYTPDPALPASWITPQNGSGTHDAQPVELAGVKVPGTCDLFQNTKCDDPVTWLKYVLMNLLA